MLMEKSWKWGQAIVCTGMEMYTNKRLSRHPLVVLRSTPLRCLYTHTHTHTEILPRRDQCSIASPQGAVVTNELEQLRALGELTGTMEEII